MNAVELHEYMQNPDLLTEDTLADIRQTMNSYPAFPALKMLYLQNLWKVNSPDFKRELEQLAIGIADRKRLYVLLKGSPFMREESAVDAAAKKDSFALIDAFLSDASTGKESVDEDKPLLLESSASSDYFHWKDVAQTDSTSRSETEPEDVKLKHQDLIDSFLEKDHSQKPVWKEKEIDDNPVQEDEEEEDVSLKQLDDSYFTETLARIYVKQKRYDKALQIIKNLSLKYPEKNIYFADQIRFLEKLIINTKNKLKNVRIYFDLDSDRFNLVDFDCFDSEF